MLRYAARSSTGYRNSRDNAPCGLWKLLNIFVCEEES
jgi:hypothetical protein